MQKKVDGLKEKMKLSDDSVSKASGKIFSPTKTTHIAALDDKTISIEQGDSIALISNGSPFSGGSKGVSFHYQPGTDMDGRFDLKALEGAAKAAKASTVSVEAWHDDDVKVLESKGYRQVAKSSFSFSKGVYEKRLGKSKRSLDDLREFLQERRGFCPTGEGGGIDNSCTATDGSKPRGGGGKQDKPRPGGGGGKPKSPQSGSPKVKPPKEKKESGGYMEWKKGKDKEAQEFVDKAREGQLARGGKSGGKSDDGGGVQTWSKGDDFPWTTKQVGTDKGYVQGQHPDGSKTEQYPFDGDATDAYKKAGEEIAKKKGKRSHDVVRETMAFLRERAR